MDDAIDVVGHIITLLDDATRCNQRVLAIRVGKDLRTAFERDAGFSYADGKFAGHRVTFDTIHPATVIVETEPA